MTKQNLAAVAAAAAAATKEPAAAPVDIDKLRREGATLERERLLSLDLLALPQCEAIVEQAKQDGTAPAECALAMVRHIKANKLLDISASMAKGAATVPALEPAPEDPVGGAQAAAPKPGTEAAWKAEYQRDAALQAEFRTEAAYVAYQKAHAGGRARIRGQ